MRWGVKLGVQNSINLLQIGTKYQSRKAPLKYVSINFKNKQINKNIRNLVQNPLPRAEASGEDTTGQDINVTDQRPEGL